jgi:hypothetical protein
MAEGALEHSIAFPAWLRCPSSCLGVFLQWRWSYPWQSLGWRWGKEMFVTGSNGKKMEEREQWAREEEERTRRKE